MVGIFRVVLSELHVYPSAQHLYGNVTWQYHAFCYALTLVLALVSSAAIASPTVDNVYKRAVASLNPASTVLPFHFPGSVYENTPYSGAASLSLSKEDEVKTATDYISNKLNLGADDFKVFNSFTDAAGVTHVYGAHMVNGARISNHQASAHVKNGEVTSFSSSFGTAQHFAKSDLAVSAPKPQWTLKGVCHCFCPTGYPRLL
ncbi:hypothetical protein BASA62_009375 [Batrachochytrium salamandrivorans]|nr:hypothetical protein BASA62_009375 [Batrachochytrium salamandrivorans]